MSSSLSLQLSRELFPARSSPLFTVTIVALDALDDATLRAIVESADRGVLGIAALYKSQRRLTAIFVASSTAVLQITGIKKGPTKQLRLLERFVTCNSSLKVAGFSLGELAYDLHFDAGVFISNGVDLQSILPKHEEDRDTPEVYFDILGKDVNKAKMSYVFLARSSKGDPSARAIVRARESCAAALRQELATDFRRAPLVSTRNLQPAHLRIMSKINRDAARIDMMKPEVQKNDVATSAVMKKDKLSVTCQRYAKRLRANTPQSVLVEHDDGRLVTARVHKVKGKAATIKLPGATVGSTRDVQLKSVTTIGKDLPTSAEKSKELILLHLLQRKLCVRQNAAFRAIWSPAPGPRRAVTPFHLDGVTVDLNPSQKLAVLHAVSTLEARGVDVQVVRGPPGTGKTWMIAAAAQALRATGRSVWLVAQSNVAVKNIAEKLARVDFLDFRLLVSKEFHFDWHEHLYEKIAPKILVSDDFPGTELEAERMLNGARVILCTLSMLSNPLLHMACFPRVVPVETLIVDEASQIELGDYLSPVHLFRSSLRRLVFVGDDKQLAPYGQDDIGNLKSIFEVDIHRLRALTLDTCYRLPTAICRYISQHVYEGKLQSQHDVPTASRTACRFIDVTEGVEKRDDKSWTNEQEANLSIILARQLHESGKRDFRIITPYDAQRALIERKLKGTNIPWQDRVFCVDSFQGNEAEYIVISVVRTTKPGFLTNMRRTNVMLTRCKRGMYICSSRSFLESSAAKKTLVGKMAKEWGPAGWKTTRDVLNGHALN